MQKITVRLPDALNEQLKTAAAADDRSVNSYLVALIRRSVAVGETTGRLGGGSSASDTSEPLLGGPHSPPV